MSAGLIQPEGHAKLTALAEEMKRRRLEPGEAA